MTAAVDRDHLARFEEAVSSTCAPVRVRPAEGDGFRSTLRSGQADGLAVAELRTTPSRVSRTGRPLTSTDPELVKLAWQRRGVS